MASQALSSGRRANACIGRAVKLIMQNVGGAKLGMTESTTLGTPMKYSMCFAEWEERATAWEPYHVTQGFNVRLPAIDHSGYHYIISGEVIGFRLFRATVISGEVIGFGLFRATVISGEVIGFRLFRATVISGEVIGFRLFRATGLA